MQVLVALYPISYQKKPCSPLSTNLFSCLQFPVCIGQLIASNAVTGDCGVCAAGTVCGPNLSEPRYQMKPRIQGLCFPCGPTTSKRVQVKTKLGPDRTPHLCQLYVTADSYASRNVRFGGAVSSGCLPLSSDAAGHAAMSSASAMKHVWPSPDVVCSWPSWRLVRRQAHVLCSMSGSVYLGLRARVLW